MKSFLLSFAISFTLLLGNLFFYNPQSTFAQEAQPPRCAVGDTEILMDSSDRKPIPNFSSPDTNMCGGANKIKSTCDIALDWWQKTGNACCTQVYGGDAYCAGDITPINQFETTFHWYCCIKASPTPTPTFTPTPTPTGNPPPTQINP